MSKSKLPKIKDLSPQKKYGIVYIVFALFSFFTVICDVLDKKEMVEDFISTDFYGGILLNVLTFIIIFFDNKFFSKTDVRIMCAKTFIRLFIVLNFFVLVLKLLTHVELLGIGIEQEDYFFYFMLNNTKRFLPLGALHCVIISKISTFIEGFTNIVLAFIKFFKKEEK